MIIVRLLGGLGNQMFQYALGRRLAEDFNTSLCVDTFLFEDRIPGRHVTRRDFALDLFKATIVRATLAETIKYSAWGLPRLLRPLARATGITREARQLHERIFGFDDQVLQCGPDAYLSGVWQSYQYFASIEATLKADFQFRMPIIPEAGEVAKAIQQTSSVCLHVRRTDYVSHQTPTSPLEFVGLDYYRTGVRRILDVTPDAEFFVFSDDLNWCKEELTFVPRVTFVPTELAGFKDSTHFQLMTLCRSFLIPNSTYSWWAAWLCSNPTKTVYVPNRWFRDETMDATGFYPEGWNRHQGQ